MTNPYRMKELEEAIATYPIEVQMRLQECVDRLQKTVGECMAIHQSADMVFGALALVTSQFGHEHGMHNQ